MVKLRLILPMLIFIVFASCFQKFNNKVYYVQKDIIATEHFGEYLIKILKDSGQYSLQYVHKEKFNNEIIPITIYATFDVSDYGKIDSLTFVYDDTKQNIRLCDFNLYLYDTLAITRDYLIGIDDYNFDNYLDFSIYNSETSGARNAVYEVFLYNSEKKKYYYHAELSNMPNLYADKEKKTITELGAGGYKSFALREFKWENEKLVLIYSLTQSYMCGFSKPIRRETHTLQNGVWATKVESLTEDEAQE